MIPIDDDWAVFERSPESVPEGGSVGIDLKRALTYPFTMTAPTFVTGALFVLASILYVPMPLVYGYAVAAARHTGTNAPLQSFNGWKQQYKLGLGFLACFFIAMFVPFLLFGLSTELGVSGISTVGALVVVLWWSYAMPWTIGVYVTGSWREYGRPSAWRWLVSRNYLATWLLTAALLIVGYLVAALSFLTIVGPLFVAFYVVVALWILLGGRYDTYRDGIDDESVWNGSADTDVDLAAVAGRVASATAAALSGAVDRVADAFEEGYVDGLEPNETEATAEVTTEETATEEQSTDDADRSEYAQLFERATSIGTSGPIERLVADDGRVQFLALSADACSEESAEAFEEVVGRWENLSNAPEVSTVYDAGEEPRPWVAFDGGDGPLALVGGDLSPAAVVAVLEDVEEAVATGRRYNRAHGELTPDCVYVEREGGTAPAAERVSATVSDWGVERAVRASLDGSTVSNRYLAPEQRRGGPPNRAVDVYQVAAVTHYALFGEPPYPAVDDDDLTDGDGDAAWSPPDGYKVGDDVVVAFERALSPDPADRHDATGDFVRAIRNALG